MTKKGQQKTCWVKAMDYLARRDHSEKELIEKLTKHFPEDQVIQTLKEVKERGWLLPPEELAIKAAESLHNKNKGHHYIQHFLRKKGLPSLPMDNEREYQKAMDLIASRGAENSETKKVASLLKNRGFGTETIGRVIHELRQNSQSLY